MTSHITALCSNCGLCCDSTLFADVELRASDQPRLLARRGLTIQQKTKSKLAFAQPCSCFDGKLCRIYEDRPSRCRSFACGLLKRTEAGEITVGAALKKISAAKRQADLVRDLLPKDEPMALMDRYSAAMSAPLDLSDPSAAKKQSQLMRSFERLMNLLLRDFLS